MRNSKYYYDKYKYTTHQMFEVDILRRLSYSNNLSGVFDLFVYSCYYVYLICKCNFIMKRLHKALSKERQVNTMDDTMKMIKAGLGIPPTTITPEYLLKMYNKGYNAAISDVLNIIDRAYEKSVKLLTTTIEELDVEDGVQNIIGAVSNVVLNDLIFGIKRNINYKELPTN